MNSLTQKSLTVGLFATIITVTGTLDVFGSFVRTGITGNPDGSCGYGYGYDSGYGYGNGYGATCATGGGSSIVLGGGGTYRFVPLDDGLTSTSNSNTTTAPSVTNTGSTTNPTTSGSTTNTNTNPYGSNYVNWDDGLSTSGSNGGAWDNNISTTDTSNSGSITNNTTITVANPTTNGSQQPVAPTVVKRTLPATGTR